LLPKHFILVLRPLEAMKKYKRKAANILLVVFSAILLSAFSHVHEHIEKNSQEITVVHAHEVSGEAPGNVSRSFVEQTGFDNRALQDFTIHSIQEFHTQLSHTGFVRIKTMVEQFKAPVKVYKQIRKFLI
jgi:hypothetical protein